MSKIKLSDKYEIESDSTNNRIIIRAIDTDHEFFLNDDGTLGGISDPVDAGDVATKASAEAYTDAEITAVANNAQAIETVSTLNDLPAVDPPQIAFVESTGEYRRSEPPLAFNITEENLAAPVRELFDIGPDPSGGQAQSYHTNDDTSKLFTFVDGGFELENSTLTEQTLSTPGDFNTVSDPSNSPSITFNDNGSDPFTSGVSFNGDGTELISIRNQDAFVHTLGTPFDLSTITLSSTPAADLSPFVSGGQIFRLKFGPNGDNLYSIDYNNDSIVQFVLSNPYDITSISTSKDGFPSGANAGSARGFAIDPAGDKFYVYYESFYAISIETLDTPFDISTISGHEFVAMDYIEFDGADVPSIGFNQSGDRILLYNNLNAVWEQYNIGRPEGFFPF
jgi:hypothetical protein